MACTDGKNTYLNIKELPEISDVITGDYLIVETPNATSIIDFANLTFTLDNTTFGDLITNNTSNTAALCAFVLASITTKTYAVFSLSGYNSGGPKLTNSTNISSVTFVPATSAIRVYFTIPYQTNQYGFTVNSLLSTFIGPSNINDITAKYIDIYIKDRNFNLTTTDRATIEILGGKLDLL